MYCYVFVDCFCSSFWWDFHVALRIFWACEVTSGPIKAVFGITGHQTTMLMDAGPCWINVGCEVVRVRFSPKNPIAILGAKKKVGGFTLCIAGNVFCTKKSGILTISSQCRFLLALKLVLPSQLEAIAWAPLCCLGWYTKDRNRNRLGGG